MHSAPDHFKVQVTSKPDSVIKESTHIFPLLVCGLTGHAHVLQTQSSPSVLNSEVLSLTRALF